MTEKPKTPSQRSEELRNTVDRDGLSPESYQKLENATGVAELKEVLLEIFEPSQTETEE